MTKYINPMQLLLEIGFISNHGRVKNSDRVGEGAVHNLSDGRLGVPRFKSLSARRTSRWTGTGPILAILLLGTRVNRNFLPTVLDSPLFCSAFSFAGRDATLESSQRR